MSPQESRILWCLVEGYPIPCYVRDIPISANVAQLKEMITLSIGGLDNVKPHHLTLWKLNVAVPVDPDHSILQRLAALGDISAFSKEFSSAEEVGDLFPEPPSRKYLHVVIQFAEIPATPGPSASLKRPRSRTEEDGRAAKRKEIGGDAQTRCVAIHEAIKAMSNELDLSNPSTFTMLPFPSLLPMPSQRFEGKTINGIQRFQYMGRSNFRELQKRVKKEHFLNGVESLYVYGTSGSGKSHLLAALVYQLLREGERVFYIPDCSSLLQEPAPTIWAALTFAFYDSDVIGTIEDPSDVPTLTRFMSNYRNLYIIVDQVNALETAENPRRNILGAMRFQHRYIYSASANEDSNRDADRKQSGISVFRIFGGMNQDETDRWFIQHSHQIPPLSPEQRQLVEYLTGRIPLLLRCLLNITNFIESEFRKMPDLSNLGLEVDTFGNSKLESLGQWSKERYLQIMKACVRGDPVSFNNRKLYDLRHFYVDDNGIGRYTCGIAFEAMMFILRTHDDAPFLDQPWYTAVSQSPNPVVQGFLAEQICLSYIAANGLKAVDRKLGRMSTANFVTDPAFDQLLSDGHAIRLYVPTAYNLMAVDGVILLLDRASKKATMFSIQFTLSQNHKQSDKEFHTRLWSKWIEPITSAGFSVHSTFVWIDKKQPSVHVEPKVVNALRSGGKVVHPEYFVVHVGVEEVNSRLASALGIQR